MDLSIKVVGSFLGGSYFNLELKKYCAHLVM